MQPTELLHQLGQIIYDEGYTIRVDQAELDRASMVYDNWDGKTPHGLRGQTRHDSREVVVANMGLADQLQVTAHELGHVLAHDPFNPHEDPSRPGQYMHHAVMPERELTCEVFSHLVAKHFGLGDCQMQTSLVVQYVAQLSAEDPDQAGSRIMHAFGNAYAMAEHVIGIIEGRTK